MVKSTFLEVSLFSINSHLVILLKIIENSRTDTHCVRIAKILLWFLCLLRITRMPLEVQ